jgi:hypothetical protein
VVAAAALLVMSAQALATAPNNESATYDYLLEVPNVAKAPSGDTISVVGEGRFTVHPKASLSGEGTFTQTVPGVGSFSGTWTALDLISFQPYGCGVFFGMPIPPNFCGGKITLRVLLVPSGPAPPHEATLWILCLIGDPPASPEEGIRMNIPGVANFNKQVSGENVYFKES